jgi:RNA polymerase sigma-70 factor (ECF subfamily)
MPPDDAPPDMQLERYRGYLRFLAWARLQAVLQGKLDPSDVVQETLLRAHKHRHQFRGPEAELAAWLRGILANVLANEARKFARGKRDVALERSLGAALDQSSVRLEKWLADKESSPSERAVRHELLLQMADALEGLPADERTALELRYLQAPPWPLAEIARHLGRPSAKAVSGLLERGLAKLRKVLREQT